MKTAFEEFAQQKQQAQQVKPMHQDYKVQQAKEVMRAKLKAKQAAQTYENQAPAEIDWKKLFKILITALKPLRKVVFFFKMIVVAFVIVVFYMMDITINADKATREKGVQYDFRTNTVQLPNNHPR